MKNSRIIGAAAAVALALGSAALAAPQAQAITNSVTINKLASKKAPWGGKVTVKPSIKATGHVKVVKKTLTVKRGKNTLAKDKTAVKLAAGTYKVTQKVSFQTYTVKTARQTVTRQEVGVSGLSEVAVTCTASKVVPVEVNAAGSASKVNVGMQCTSPQFDGKHGVDVTLSNDWGTWFGYSTTTNDHLEAVEVPEVGVPFEAILTPWDDLMVSYQVTHEVSTKVYSKTSAKTKTQTLVIKKGKKPTSVWVGGDRYSCPKGFPVKGNADSGIYHVPGNRWYKATMPEECFSSPSAARAAGYRAAKV